MLAFPSVFDRTYSSSLISERDGVITLSIDMPGVKKEDLTLMVDRGILSVTGERKNRDYKYSRRWRLADDMDPTAITAALEDGVLTVTIPRKTDQLARKIPIN